nr:carboxymuconolactone decarboxylase family protein [Halomonas socia]
MQPVGGRGIGRGSCRAAVYGATPVELVTLAAARALGNTYCALAHARALAVVAGEGDGVSEVARAFFTRMLDGQGAEADAAFRELPGPLIDALSVGRLIASATAGD